MPEAADRLFAGVFSTPAADAATSDAAWLRAMLDVERAIAVAGARVGLVPDGAARAIVAACEPALFDVADLAALAAGAATQATPIIALVARLRELAGPEAAGYVHLAATSQDIIDSAAMLVARAALGAILDDARAVADLLAALAREHRDAPQIGRSFLQHGAVTTFGAGCAARLVALDEARGHLAEVGTRRLAVQFGGAVGTLAPAGPLGTALLAQVARELGLAEPVVPWHTSRGRVAELAGALGVLTGELAAAAQDVVLLSASELAEVEVASPGGSSAMAHKRNPASAVLALACAHRVPALVASILAGMPQELQRSPGRWQAEWGTLVELVRLAAGTARHTRVTFDGLRVDVGRMSAHVTDFLIKTATDPRVAAEPDTGSATAFVDRALAAHESER